MKEIKGIITALSTPMHADESLKLDVLEQLIERLIADGVGGIFVAGSMGEGISLSLEEKVSLAKSAARIINGRVPLLAGTGAITTREVIQANARLADVGVDAFSVLAPSYWKPSQEEIYRHFSDIIAASPVPVMVYNIPRNTGNNVEPETIGRLYRQAGLAGAKDSSGDIANLEGYIRQTGDDFTMLVGSDALILKGLSLGAKGAISAPSNMLTRIPCAIYSRFAAGDAGIDKHCFSCRDDQLAIGRIVD